MNEGHALRRKHKRYRLEAPMVFSWKDNEGIRRKDKGLTRDMSAAGTYIMATNPPPLYTAIRLEGVVLSNRITGTPLLIRGQGRVVRVEPANGGKPEGFAVAGRGFIIRRIVGRR